MSEVNRKRLHEMHKYAEDIAILYKADVSSGRDLIGLEQLIIDVAHLYFIRGYDTYRRRATKRNKQLQ